MIKRIVHINGEKEIWVFNKDGMFVYAKPLK